MTDKIRIAVFGIGHIGTYAAHAAQMAEDMRLVGLVDIPERLPEIRAEFPGVTCASQLSELPEKPDVAVLGVPTRSVEKIAPVLLAEGIRTVDAFDMHGEPFARLKSILDPVAKKHMAAAVMGSGVDPGVSTMIRALFEAWAPRGLTYVTYGPGMSMGHTVAAKSYPGVRDALSITRPGQPGRHERDLYLEIEDGADFEEVKARVLADSYFCNDDVRVFQVPDVTPLVDLGHAIQIFRKGSSSGVSNQLLRFETTFHNPASTAQVLVSTARACLRLPPGAHTMLEIPLAYFLPESIESLLERLV